MSDHSASPDRREFLATSLAASALGLLPTQGAVGAADNGVHLFRFAATDQHLADLRRRVAATSWPD